MTTNDTVRDQHSRGESYHAAAAPDIVCFPLTTDEVSAVVKASAAAEVPMVPFGAGTSLEGHVSALAGSMSIDLSRMTRLLRVSAEDLDATVEAGVAHMTLNHALRNTGLFSQSIPEPTRPSVAWPQRAHRARRRSATERCARTCWGCQVVMSDGRIINTGGRARNRLPAIACTDVFVGSEGTLGVIAEVTLRLHGRPEAVAAAVCSLPSLEGAVATVIATIQLGIAVARIELLDEVQMNAVNRYSHLNYPVAPTLFSNSTGRATPA